MRFTARFLQKATNDDELRRASLLAGLKLFGLPHPENKEAYQYMQKFGIDLKAYKLHSGSGLMWAPQVHQTTAEAEYGQPTPALTKFRGKAEPFSDAAIAKLKAAEDDWAIMPRVRIKVSQPVEALDQEGSSTARGVYSARVVTLPPQTVACQNGGEIKPFAYIAQAGMMTLPAIDEWREDRYAIGGKEHIKEPAEKRQKYQVENVKAVADYFKRFPDQEWLYLYAKPVGYCYIPLSVAKQVCTITFPAAQDTNDTVTPWGDAKVDTFSYVFFPSTGKGIDAADEFNILDPRVRDADGKVYLADGDGLHALALPVNATEVFKELKKRSLL